MGTCQAHLGTKRMAVGSRLFPLALVLVLLGQAHQVSSGPVAALGCILTCVAGPCATSAAVCLPAGAATGPLAVPAAIACFMGFGGACAACISASLLALG